MRYRVVGFTSLLILLIAVGVLWGSNNFAAQPAADLMHRAYTFIAIGASRPGDDWIQDAAVLFERAAMGDASAAEAHLMAAMSFEITGDVERAIKHYEAVRTIAPSFPVDAMIGDAYLSVDDPDGAEAAYLQALEVDPHSVMAHSGLARVNERLGRLIDSESHLRQIVAITEGDVAAYLDLSRFFLRVGQPVSALSALEEIEEQKRGGAAYFAQLGFVYEALGKTDEACTQLRSALRYGSSDPAVSASIERLACGARS